MVNRPLAPRFYTFYPVINAELLLSQPLKTSDSLHHAIRPGTEAAVLTFRWMPLAIFVLVAAAVGMLLFREKALAVITSIIQPEDDKSTGYYDDLISLWISECLWLGGFTAVFWMLNTFLNEKILSWPLKANRVKVATTVIIALSLTSSVLVATITFDRFPNSADEYAYLYQAETYSRGELWERPHPEADFFTYNHIAQKDNKRAGRFPPGWPVLLSVAFLLDMPPYLVNPILGVLTLLLIYRYAKRFYNETVAFWATVSVGLTSYFIFNNASFFSHTSCMLVTVGFVFAVGVHLEKSDILHAVLAGFCLGMMVIIRYYTALLIFVPFVAYIIFHRRISAVTTFFWMGVGLLPPILFLLWYNYSITGNAMMPVTMWAYQDEALGFVRGHTWAKGVEHVVRWMFMFVYWCSPALLIMYGTFLVRKGGVGSQRPQDYVYLLLIIGYFFYYEIGGNQYGPRYFLEAFPFLVIFVVDKVFAYKQRWAYALFLAGCIYAVVKIPFIAHREHEIITERQDVYRLVEERELHNAVVLIASPTSVKRPMPIGDLLRNDFEYSNPVLFARDLRERNKELFEYYPSREFYRYVRGVNEVEGKLVRVR